MADSVVNVRTLRGRIEPRSAREHRRLEKLFKAAQEARNAVIEDSRSARAWNLLQLRRHARKEPEWKPGPHDFFDWQGKAGPLEAGKLARFSSRVARNRTVTRLRAAGKMPLASECTVSLARAEVSRMAKGLKKGGRKPLRYRGWRERRSVEWERVPPIAWVAGSRMHGKLTGKDTGSLRFRLYESLPEGARIRSARIARTQRGERGVGPSVYELHLSVEEARVERECADVVCLVGVDAGGRARQLRMIAVRRRRWATSGMRRASGCCSGSCRGAAGAREGGGRRGSALRGSRRGSALRGSRRGSGSAVDRFAGRRLRGWCGGDAASRSRTWITRRCGVVARGVGSAA